MKTIIKRNDSLSDVHFSFYLDDLRQEAFDGVNYLNEVVRGVTGRSASYPIQYDTIIESMIQIAVNE